MAFDRYDIWFGGEPPPTVTWEREGTVIQVSFRKSHQPVSSDLNVEQSFDALCNSDLKRSRQRVNVEVAAK